MDAVTGVTTRVKLTYPVDALVSYHYYREDRHMVPLVSTGRLRLIGDSGAFSAWSQGATIELAEYAGWCRRWWDYLCWCASLDVIGDPQATWRNWAALRDRHQLLTVPTLHAGADPKWLDAYAAEGVDLVGLGGMAGTGQAPRAFRWAVHLVRYARRRWPKVRFHLWGVTNRQFLDVLPVWSADSSGTLGAGYRYGEMRLFDPATGQHLRLTMRRGAGSRDMYRHSQLLRRVYGVDPAAIEESNPGNRAILIQLAAAATQQYAVWLQRRHKVTAPAMFRAGQIIGPNLHMVAEGWHSATPDLLHVADGPRVHVAMATGGRRQGDEAVLAGADPTHGPRVHLTDSNPSHLAAMAQPATGPRLHVVAGTNQAPGANDLDPVVADEGGVGPRYHVVDGHPGHMLAITDNTSKED